MLYPVLHEKYRDDIASLYMISGRLIEHRNSLKVVNVLKKLYPLEELGHLKRIRSEIEAEEKHLDVLICKYDGNFKDNLSGCLRSEDLKDCISDLRVILVPKSQPLTRVQFDKCKLLWPTSFHEDKYITNLKSGDFFAETELQKINHFMSSALSVAKQGMLRGMFPVGAVVVDPKTNSILVSAHDCSLFGDPLLHAVMVCVDLVAKLQGGGALDLQTESLDNGILTLSNIAKKPNNVSKAETNIEKDKSCNQNSPEVEGTNNSDGNQARMHTTDKSFPQDSENPSLKRKIALVNSTEQYLCTGFDLYVTHEPCTMCAMALVHSRIRRVFYGVENLMTGSLGSVFNVHCQDGLNHHFEVFKNVCRDQCMELGQCSREATLEN